MTALDQRLRLMHVVFSLQAGGLENGVVNICNRLPGDTFRPSVCVFRGGGTLESRLRPERVDFCEVRRIGNHDPTLPWRLARQLRRQKIDIIHTHSWGTLVEGVLAAKLAGTPVIIHGEHGILEERPRNIPIQRWLWSRSQQVTSVAGPLADRMARCVGFPRDRIQVIPNGVDTDRFQPSNDRDACRKSLGISSQALLIGMVARLVPVKNHLGVLQAIAQLSANGWDVHLAMAGDGPLQGELRRAARGLHLSERVSFLGELAAVDPFLNALDVFVLNSHSEGMSNTVMEAMACGLPIVATSVGANPELIRHGDTGYLVPAGDAAALLEALAILARERSRRERMGRAGRRRIVERYGIEKMVQDYADLYHRLGGASAGAVAKRPKRLSTFRMGFLRSDR